MSSEDSNEINHYVDGLLSKVVNDFVSNKLNEQSDIFITEEEPVVVAEEPVVVEEEPVVVAEEPIVVAEEPVVVEEEPVAVKEEPVVVENIIDQEKAVDEDLKKKITSLEKLVSDLLKKEELPIKEKLPKNEKVSV